MRVTTDIAHPRERETAVAVGFFDGVHLGHRAVIGSMVDAARQEHLVPTVFAFTTGGTLPDSKTGITLLQTEAQKERVMELLGVEEVVAPTFDAFMSLSPQQYVDGLLHTVLRAKVVVCGENYRFGSHAAGGITELKQLAAPHGIRVIIAPPVLWQATLVSSTRIRQAVKAGEAAQVEAMLGAPFAIEGIVGHGKQLGRTISSPTINLALPQGFVIPAHGVYLSQVSTPHGIFWGVTNIGNRPTVGGQDTNCETYLLNFEGELYGKPVAVALKQYLRPEQKFPTVTALSQQIQVDIQTALALITEHYTNS